MQRAGWNVLDDERGVWWREYEFTRGAWATTLAFRTDEGVVVVSPAPDLEAHAYDALAELGPVRALVANNGQHHLGQPSWRARFRDAQSYAPPAALPVLVRKLDVPFRSLAELPLPAHVHWQDAPGFAEGETLLAIEGRRGPIWLTGDLVTNIQRTPGPPLRWLFTMTDSAFGLKLFRLAVWGFVKDRRAVRTFVEARFAALPPKIIVPAHGPPIETDDLYERALVELAKL